MKISSIAPVLGLLLVAAGASACKKSESEAPPATTGTTPSAPAPTAPSPVEGHGDHNAQHGGAVLMDERGHMELVFGDDGAIAVWLSDNMRKPVPASTASTLELSVTRPGQAEEKIALARDGADASWTGKAAPITDPATKVHFAYNAAGKQAPYQIDISLADLRKMQAAVEPEHQHGDEHGDEHADHPRDTHQGDGHSEHQHGAAHGEEDEAGHIPPPATLEDAVTQMNAAYDELAAIVKDGDLSKAHATAERLGDVGDALPKLAATAKLPPESVKALTVAGKKLRLFFADMDKAGDSGDRKAAQQTFARYKEPVATIKAKAGV